MGEFKTYPPAYVKPGDTIRLEADNGEVEFIGIYDDRVIDFITSYYEMEQLSEGPIPPSKDRLDYAQRKTAKLFNRLPPHLKRLVFEKSAQGGIWIPDKEEGGL